MPAAFAKTRLSHGVSHPYTVVKTFPTGYPHAEFRILQPDPPHFRPRRNRLSCEASSRRRSRSRHLRRRLRQAQRRLRPGQGRACRHRHVEFWGIEANPKVETLRKCIDFGRRENVGFILAVGGGSVLDGSKLVACALAEGETRRCMGHRPLAPPGALHALRKRHDASRHGLRNERQQRHLPP